MCASNRAYCDALAGAATPALAKQPPAIQDYVNPLVQDSYSQTCGQAFIVVCVSTSETWHVSVGLSFGLPGISYTNGFVQGSTGDDFLCGWSQTGSIAYGAGVEYGTNPGTGDTAVGFQMATPGFGVNQTYGLHC